MKTRLLPWHIPLLSLGLFLGGCSHINSLAGHMDAAVTRLAEGRKHTYEGELKDFEKIGSMTALHFTDGQLFDVEEAPMGMGQGDIVRLYKTDKGLVAHLWRRAS